MAPPGTSVALDDELLCLVLLFADDADLGGVAGTAQGEVVEPLRVLSGRVGAASATLGAPLALPRPVRHLQFKKKIMLKLD